MAIAATFVLLTVISAASPEFSDRSSAEPMQLSLPDGATSAEIQQALDLLPDAGGEVILAAGDYEISAPLVLRRDSQTLRGAGAATVLRVADGANCPAIIMGQPVNHPRTAIRRLRVAGLYIDGNRSHQQSELWRPSGEGSEIRNNGITVQDVNDSTVQDVVCAHCRSGGLVTTLGVRRLTVQNFESFDNQFDGLACYLTVDSQFTDLNLHDNPGAGISLDLTFAHNSFTNAVLTANDLGIFMRSSTNNRFQNVSIRRSHHFGVFIAEAGNLTARGWQPLAHSQCTDNLFVNLVATNCGGAAFHVNNADCTNNVVTGTQVVGTAFHPGLAASGARANF